VESSDGSGNKSHPPQVNIPTGTEVTVYAPAKLNLFLDITGLRYDGYHLMKMVMQTVDLCDIVTISVENNGSSTLFCDGVDVPNDGNNTALKAVKTFFDYTNIENPGIHVKIEKNIPSQAGLGGASSDAAAVFVGLNHLFETNLPMSELCFIGARVGADVPFCIFGGAAYVEGIGEILTALPSLTEDDCRFVIVKPDHNVSTVQAFAQYDELAEKPALSGAEQMTNAIALRDIETIGKCVGNAFEAVVSPEETERIKAVFMENDAIGAGMSGSGSSVFGIFESASAAKRAAKELSDFGETHVVRPISTGAYIDD